MKYLGKKNIIYAVIAIASVAVCAIVANAYQNGNIFVPSGTDRGLNANQVSFSGDGDVHDNGDDDKSGESELWDKDDNAEDTQKPKNADDADYLFRNDAQLPYKSNDRTLISNGLSSGLSGNMISGNSDSIYSIVDDKSGADIVINSGSAINGNKKDENMSNGSNSEYSDEGGNDGSSDTVNNGTQGGSSGSNNSGSSSGKDNFSENPEKHNYADTAKDPDPDNSSESGPAYSENITKPAGNPDDNGDYNSVVIDKPSKSDDKSLLYKGQSVTKKIIYAALDKFVLDENLELYEFGSDAYDKYMRIVGISFDAGETWITEFPVTIPEQIEEGMMFIRTEYRISTKSDTWVKRDVSYDPESVRIFLLSQKLKEENATINESDIINMGSFKYPEPGDTVNLYRYISDMLGDSDERLTQLFPGWMENGEIVPFNYKAVSGRHILEPADMTALDDDYEAELSYKWMDDDGNIDIQGNNLVYLQTLKNYYKSDSVYALAREWITGRSELLSLKVPKYIQAIDMYEDAGIAVGYIEIPSTVIYINNSNGGFSVRNGYIVDEENQYYCSKNGVLYNKAETDDGEGSKVVLISVPDNLTEFDGTVTAGDGSSVAVYEINESAFKGCSELKWVTLPESVKCIGSNAFKNCSKLEGILIDSKDDIRIENRAFDTCESLRFIASNAMHANVANGYTPYITDRYKNASERSKFFLALPDADGYEAFANQMAGSTGVEKYVMQDAGSDAKILYAATSNGIPWVALRAAKELPDEVVLPESVTEIYDSAFADTTAASGSGSFTIKNWANENIWSIGSLAFRSSELTGDIIISSENSNYNVRIDSYAFAYSGITSIDVKGDVNALGESIFEYCKNLKSVSIDQMTDSAANKVCLCSGSFTGCENFTDLTFNCIPNLAIYGVIPFRFNDDIDADVEAESIRIHLPAGTEEQCVRKLRYLFAGYSALTYDNAYLQMRDFIKFSNIDWETFELPSEEDVDALLSDELLCAENRIRTMIGLETVSEPVNLYQYYTDSDGIVTLTSVPSDAENITLTCEQMEMPDGWYVSCIAANAFSKCKDLKSVTIPEKLSSIESGAFAGMESSNLTLKLMDTEAPVLQNISVDEPFTFGIDADRLSIEVPDGCIDSYISSWAFPLAGYTSFSDMFSTICDETERELNGGKNGYEEDMSDDSDDQEAVQSQTSDEKIKTIAYERMAELLMPAENTLRTIFGKEQITDADGLICLKNHQATELIDIDDENDITSDDNVTDMNDDENDDEETEFVIENDDPLKNDGQLTLETDENQEEEKAE